jgi:hypothetical protein
MLGVALLLGDLGDPLVDHGRVAAGLQRRPVAGELALAVGQGLLGGPQPRVGVAGGWVWAAASRWQAASMLAGLTSRASHASSFGARSASRR